MKHLYIILFILPLIGFGQGWEVTFGGNENDEGFSVQQTIDGGYILTGTTYTLDNQEQIYLIKTDENGELEWEQTYGGTGIDQGFSVQQTSDGGYVITGIKSDLSWSGNDLGDGWLIKTDENGELEWEQTYGGDLIDRFDSVKQTDDGGYIMTGWTSSFFPGGVYVIKTDENGDSLWMTTHGSISSSSFSLDQTDDGGYIITGHESVLNEGVGNVGLFKIDDNGELEWEQTCGEEYGVGNSVQQTSDGGYIITGFKIPGESQYFDLFLRKTFEDGSLDWEYMFGEYYIQDQGHSVQQTIDGGYIITGLTSSSGNNNVYLLKTNGNGIEEWSQTFGGSYNDGGRSVQQTSDGGYIITGFKDQDDFGDGGNFYLIKTNEFGNITSTIELPNPTSKRELIKTTNILGQENTTIKNQPMIEIYDDGSTEKKIVIE